MIITHPTYDTLHMASHLLATNIKQAEIKPDIIVALVRGGTLPAMIISHDLDVPMVAVHYSSTDGCGDNKNHCNDLPELSGKTVLIVDDICDSGKTLQEVCDHYKNDHVLHTAVWYYKEMPDGFIPDFYWHKIPQDSPWIIFPFEVKDGNMNNDELGRPK